MTPSAKPDSIVTIAVINVIAKDGVVLAMKRVERSRAVTQNTVAIANRYQTEKSVVPGRMIKRTPISPTADAVQRRQPTGALPARDEHNFVVDELLQRALDLIQYPGSAANDLVGKEAAFPGVGTAHFQLSQDVADNFLDGIATFVQLA